MAEHITPEELKALIEQTYLVEDEYKALRSDYAYLQDTIEQIVEFLPNAIWVLEEDGEIFLQNSIAKDLGMLLPMLQHENDDYEVSFQEHSYLIKSNRYKEKRLFSATDITEQKRKENLATMGQMAAHLSHEIRNPIGAISLMTSTLSKRVIDENRPMVEEIQKSVFRIERIIKATLLFSKGIKADIKAMRWSEVDEALKKAIEYYSHSKAITFKLPAQKFILAGDADLLAMMFSNFIFNAIDAIELDDEESGMIEMTYARDEQYHVFVIYDSGVPIDEEKALFEAFKSNKVKGNGLGLVLSQQIAEAHGGDVSLEKGDRKGFRIRLLRSHG